MSVISMKQLLEAGVHFGHQTRRWNPKMAQYIFTERNGIYIIDLQKTVKKAEEAYKAMKEIAETGKPVLFVGTKKQAQEAIKEEAERCGMFYVNERWLGGMLTNHKTIQTRINKLRELERILRAAVLLRRLSVLLRNVPLPVSREEICSTCTTTAICILSWIWKPMIRSL